ncbi:hypothetical protein [Shewanella marina]|uniref:hypothetical protein n=1 Tax=Shewanella marina TaxID=487319 RepID=UPI000471F3A8|nr:hypothetical protein [Shewanella marina]
MQLNVPHQCEINVLCEVECRHCFVTYQIPADIHFNLNDIQQRLRDAGWVSYETEYEIVSAACPCCLEQVQREQALELSFEETHNMPL